MVTETEEFEAVDGLSGAQTRALIALMEQNTVKSAAKSADVGYSTLMRWLQDPIFVEAYRKARLQSLEGAVSRLVRASTSAVEALEDCLAPQTPASVRVRAALGLLDRAFSGLQLTQLSQMVEEYEQESEEDEDY